MERLALMIDLERCIGCKSCEAACKQEHGLGPGEYRNKVVWLGDASGIALDFLTVTCQHCERPACLRACPVNPKAIVKDAATGVVSVVEDRCTGCGECVIACPYGAMGYDQVFSALQTGVIDGAENNPPSFVFDNHYQAAKFYSDSQHLIVPEMLVYSKTAWDQLSADDQALIKKVSRDAQMEARELWDKKEADALERMKSGGIEIDHIADKKPFQDAVKPVWDKYGAKFAELIKQIQAVS